MKLTEFIIFLVICLIFYIHKKRNLIDLGRAKGQNKLEPWTGELWDMHCHILHAVDDGAENIDAALAMIEKEIEQGVTDIMLTPHYIARETDSQFVQKQYKRLVQEVKKREYPIRLYLGNEIFYNMDIVCSLQNSDALTLAGSSYVLIEFDKEISFRSMKSGFLKLQMAGYRPILAHLERFSCLNGNVDRVKELVRQGVFMQVNANSFLNKKTAGFLTTLAKNNLIHFIGTDCHHVEWRPPQIEKTVSYLRNQLEEEQVKNLFFGHCHKLLINKTI